jgi:fucose 4-O-acetylase-like acetyltransferase
MNNTMNTTRINYIDALRGFTMFLVVFGHVMTITFNLCGYDSVISSIFLTFRMPLFFFVAGFLTYKLASVWDFSFYKKNIKEKFLVQIIPTFFFFSIYMICKGINPISSLLDYGFGGYWFTIVLFEMFFIYFTIAFLCHYFYVKHKSRIIDLILISISIIGLVVLIFFRGIGGQLWSILCLENLTKYFQFFVFGILCKKYLNKFVNIINREYFKGG